MMNAKRLYVSFVKFGHFYVSVVLFSSFRAFYWDGKIMYFTRSYAYLDDTVGKYQDAQLQEKQFLVELSSLNNNVRTLILWPWLSRSVQNRTIKLLYIVGTDCYIGRQCKVKADWQYPGHSWSDSWTENM